MGKPLPTHGNTALISATVYGDTEVVKMLIEAGADRTIRNQIVNLDACRGKVHSIMRKQRKSGSFFADRAQNRIHFAAAGSWP